MFFPEGCSSPHPFVHCLKWCYGPRGRAQAEDQSQRVTVSSNGSDSGKRHCHSDDFCCSLPRAKRLPIHQAATAQAVAKEKRNVKKTKKTTTNTEVKEIIYSYLSLYHSSSYFQVHKTLLINQISTLMLFHFTYKSKSLYHFYNSFYTTNKCR